MPLSLDSLPHVRAFIFDLDGVIWRGASPIEGAAASVERLKALGKQCFYATNNSARAPRWFAERLNAMGILATPGEVVTSATATASYVGREFPGARVFVVGEDGVQGLLRDAGARVFVAGDVAEDEPIEVVVAGIDRGFTYEKLRLAQQFILKGARFIATNRDATFPVEGGVVPGAGSIVAAISAASHTVPLSMGKPEPTMLLEILTQFGLDKSEAVMVGDRLDTDIACGARAGIGTILVETGVTTPEAARAATGEEKPDLIFADLRALLRAVEGQRE